MGRVIIKANESNRLSLEKNPNFGKLPYSYQGRLQEIIGFVSHYIDGPPLVTDIIIEPMEVGKPTISYNPSTRTMHLQVILLSDQISIDYTYFVVHHDFILHCYLGLKEEEALCGSATFLLNNPEFAKKLSVGLNCKLIHLCPGNNLLAGILSGEVEQIIEQIKIAREYLAEEKYELAQERIQGIDRRLKSLLSSGTDISNRLLVYYYIVKIMLKAIAYHSKMFNEGRGKHSMQVLVLDSQRERILLQKRGLFKRIFASKYTVSANAKIKEGDCLSEAAVRAVNDEIGINIDSARFTIIGKPMSYRNYFVSYDFYALSSQEEEKLLAIYNELRDKHVNLNGILLDYDKNKRSLCVFAVSPEVNRDTVRLFANEIKNRVGVPYIYPVYDDDKNSLVTVQLSKEEELLVERKAKEKIVVKSQGVLSIAKEVDLDSFTNLAKNIDSDDMEFRHWVRIKNDFAMNPLDYALDLSGPYFGNDLFWDKLGMLYPEVIDVDNPIAVYVSVAGGKGSNTHILRNVGKFFKQLRVPESSIITAHVYESIVLGNEDIRNSIELLEQTKDEQQIKIYPKKLGDIQRLTCPFG